MDVRRIGLLICALLLAGQLGCRAVPVTERRQLMLIPETEETALGITAYEEILRQEPRSTNQYFVQLVNRVGNRIAAASGRPDYQWEFHVIASPQQNAFALPGGKVAIYEGILPLCANEAGLAVVMSHEVAHAMARHGGERMSHGYVVNGMGNLLSYVMQNQDAQRRKNFEQAYGVASQYGFVLPYSRKHELEADHIGLLLMARAGYDPREAPRFWQRFAEAKGTQPVELLSTHPADQRRSEALAGLLADAVPLYEASAQKFGLGEQWR